MGVWLAVRHRARWTSMRRKSKRQFVHSFHGVINLVKKFSLCWMSAWALQAIYNTVFDRKVPKVNWWFTLGSASLFLFTMQW